MNRKMATDWHKPELWGVLWSNFKVWTSSPNNMVQTTGHLLLYLQKNVSSLGIIWKPLHLLLRQTLAVRFPVQNPFYEMQLHRDKPFYTTPGKKYWIPTPRGWSPSYITRIYTQQIHESQIWHKTMYKTGTFWLHGTYLTQMKGNYFN